MSQDGTGDPGHVWADHGANQSHTIHRVAPPTAPQGRNKAEWLYSQSGDQVRGPRSYEDGRPKQTLRWLATKVQQDHPAGQEVQVYYDKANHRLIMSSNTNAENARIKAEIASAKAQGRRPGWENDRGDARQSRHGIKLRDALVNTGDDEGDKTGIVHAIRNLDIVVPDDVASGDDGLHAERRIDRMVNGTDDDRAQLDFDRLGGRKRPCGACYKELGFREADADVRAGPVWPSGAAMKGTSLDDVREYYETHDVATHVTRDRVDDSLHWDNDTDSDSDPEEEKKEDDEDEEVEFEDEVEHEDEDEDEDEPPKRSRRNTAKRPPHAGADSGVTVEKRHKATFASKADLAQQKRDNVAKAQKKARKKVVRTLRKKA